MGKEDSGIELGIYTFGELLSDPFTGESLKGKQRIDEIIEAAKLADDAGLEVFGIGEHHRIDFAVSSPHVILAAIAQNTQKIKLTSATTVLSTIDPVRLFEDFATLDIVSNGRAEIVAGRGAFSESFPLFGYDLKEYDSLFSEHIDLLLKLNRHECISWTGKFRSELHDTMISPRPIQDELPIWIGVGGTLESSARAGRLGTGLMIAALGGEHAQITPLIETYRREGLNAGHKDLKVAIASHCFISETSQKAKQEFYPYYLNYFKSFMRNGGLMEIPFKDFEEMTSQNRSLFVGSPQEVTEKIIRQYEMFGHQRFLAQIDIGGLPFHKVAKSIELLATEIAPVVRRETKKQI